MIRKMKIFLFFLLSLMILHNAGAQVFINEVCPSNNSVLIDEDGDMPDWIELYNSGSSVANLSGYWLSDDDAIPGKWIFPYNVNIQPAGFLTVFASGKDKKNYFHHWETVVQANDSWRYIVPASEPDSNWRRLPAFNDYSWNVGIGGIGYGDNDDNTTLTPPVNSVFLRHVFNIVDTGDIASAVFNIDYDDAFVAYLNGVEIARSNIGVNGTPAPFNSPALAEHEARMYAGGKPDQYYIDEKFLKSFLKNGNNILAIQVHNNVPSSSDLSSLPWLSLGIKSASSNYGTVPAWFNLSASSLHTNFKLASGGETVLLSDPSGTLVNKLTFGSILADNSYGCLPDGSSTFKLFGKPTPNASNNAVTGYSSYTGDPVFSINGGFYPCQQTLTLSTSTPGGIIHYSLNGKTPDINSAVYSAPIIIDSTTVISARTYHPTLLEGETITNSYFISDSSSATLPVVSLTVSPVLMFDPVTGIYVKGPNADAGIPFFGANFWQEREIPAHIEYYDKQRQQGFEQNVGIEIYGNYSRSFPQKSLKIIARDCYGNGSFNYKLFASKDIYSFKQFILRNSGTDWNGAHFRDALVHSLALKPTECDVMAYQPTVVYINGKYWGVYNIREKINKDYLADNHGANPDSVDLLQYNGLVMSGSNKNFIQAGTYVVSNDLTNPANFAVAETLFDTRNFADYFATETWSDNWDWLTNNVRYWRENKAGQKWRYILWDLDNGMGGQWSYTANSLDSNLHKPYDYTSILFSKLLTNKGYRDYFINRYADLLNTAFTPQNFTSMLYSFRDTLDGEMPRHFKRWGTGFKNPEWGMDGFGDYNGWRNYQIPELAIFSANRQITARNHIEKTFGLKKQVSVTLNVNPPGAGKIKINTVIPDNLPWAGIYFDSVPVTVTAIPNAGYQFSFWQSGILFPVPQPNQSIIFNPDTGDVFTAYFFGAPDTAKIIFSEINYNSSVSADAGDWVEIHNYSLWDFDLSQWKFKDSQNSNMYVFPENTVLQGGEYIVLCQDTAKFRSVYPGLTNVKGPFGFGLSAAGETLRLFDTDMNLYLSATYSGGSPWTSDANGTGKTLELLSVNGDINNPANWFAGCTGGSPGGPFAPCDNSGLQTEPLISDGIVSVYPNPAKENLVIDINPEILQNSVFSVMLFDISGRPVMNIKSVSKEETIINNSFRTGLYFYKITSDNGYLKTGKIVFM